MMARILVVCGGDSYERMVSLESGDAVARGLARAGHDVVKLDTASPGKTVGADEPLLDGPVGIMPPEEIETARLDREGWIRLMQTIAESGAEAVFPILHGGWGEDGRVQAMFELLELPYLGSGVMASQLCMDKVETRRYAEHDGLPLADGGLVNHGEDAEEAYLRCVHDYGSRLVVKPQASGSTVDVYIVDEQMPFIEAVRTIRDHGEVPLVEKYIPGRELTVSIIGDRPFPVIEIRPHDRFYDYTSKYTKGETDYLCPAPIPDATAIKLQELSVKVFMSLGCRHLARVDWRLDPEDNPFFLEVNTIPGMTDLSLVPMAANEAGLDFPGLMDRFVQLTLGEPHS